MVAGAWEAPRIPGGPSARGRRVRAPRTSASAGWGSLAAPAVAGVFYAQAAWPPQRGESWRHAQPAAPGACPAPGAAVWAVSQQAPAGAQAGGPGLRTEAKTGRPALARAAPTWPRPPGLVERPASASLRQGPPGLSANVDGAPGEGGAPPRGPRRTAAACAAPRAPPLAPAPEAPGLLLVAPLNRQKSAALGRRVASACGLADDRGEQEKRGRVPSMPTRTAGLRDVRHRLRCMSTPQHTRWRRHIARWCSIWVRRWRRRGNFTSVADVRERLLAFMPSCNKTMAKPFKWTYKGRPLTGAGDGLFLPSTTSGSQF